MSSANVKTPEDNKNTSKTFSEDVSAEQRYLYGCKATISHYLMPLFCLSLLIIISTLRLRDPAQGYRALLLFPVFTIVMGSISSVTCLLILSSIVHGGNRRMNRFIQGLEERRTWSPSRMLLGLPWWWAFWCIVFTVIFLVAPVYIPENMDIAWAAQLRIAITSMVVCGVVSQAFVVRAVIAMF